jgi:hypothetical protein
VTSTELLAVIAAAIVIVGIAWYLRGRREDRAARLADPDLPREQLNAHIAAEGEQGVAILRAYCPSCQTERDFRGRVCVECGYRLP